VWEGGVDRVQRPGDRFPSGLAVGGNHDDLREKENRGLREEFQFLSTKMARASFEGCRQGHNDW